MSGLNGSLGHRVRDQEEIELSIDDLGLLDESVVHIGTLRRVEDLRSMLGATRSLLKESLSHTLVNDDQGNMGKNVTLALGVVLISEDLLKLVELELDNLLSHGVTDTITIDEDVVWQVATVEVLIGGKGASEVLLKDVRGNDFLTLLVLRTGLGIVLAKERIISGDETNDTLLALVANVDADKHGLGRNFLSEAHSPEITSKLGVNLTDNVEVNAVVVFVDGLACDELGNDRVVRVNLVLDSSIEVLLSQGVRDNDEEELDDGLAWVLFSTNSNNALLSHAALRLANVHVVAEVGIDGILEVFNQ
jgi:hypothetical protein